MKEVKRLVDRLIEELLIAQSLKLRHRVVAREGYSY